jgi:hypothetical protein
VANLTTFLGETIKDGLPTIPGVRGWEERARILAKAGDEFLNVVFGWEPLLSDIRSTAKAIRHAHAVMKQFERDAGRVVRRSYVFPTTTDSNTVLLSANAQPYLGTTLGEGQGESSCNWSYISDTGKLWKTTKTVRRTWFSGAFTYHIPGTFPKSMTDAFVESQKVFGLSLNPQTLWELTPWSWAVDWVTNAQDVLTNLSARAQYGQVLRYGYIMEHTMSMDIYSFQRTSFPDVSVGGIVSSGMNVPTLIVKTETKKRRGANPYGFGITWEGLNATQLAILGALGITK